MATPAKRALDFDQLEQKSRTDTISEAIREVDVTPVDDTKVNTTTNEKAAAVEETNKTKSPVNKGSKTKIKPINFANAAASKAPASTISSSSSLSRRPATTPTRSQSLTSKISNGPIKTSEVKKAVLPTAAAAASKEAMTKSTSSSDSVSSSSTAVRNYPLFCSWNVV